MSISGNLELGIAQRICHHGGQCADVRKILHGATMGRYERSLPRTVGAVYATIKTILPVQARGFEHGRGGSICISARNPSPIFRGTLHVKACMGMPGEKGWSMEKPLQHCSTFEGFHNIGNKRDSYAVLTSAISPYVTGRLPFSCSNKSSHVKQ